MEVVVTPRPQGKVTDPSPKNRRYYWSEGSNNSQALSCPPTEEPSVRPAVSVVESMSAHTLSSHTGMKVIRLSVRKRRLMSGGMALVMLSVGISLAIRPATAVPAEDQHTSLWMDISKTATARAGPLLKASSQHQKYRWLNEQAALVTRYSFRALRPSSAQTAHRTSIRPGV